MPTSHHTYISDVIGYVRRKKPKTVLDIGVGFGKWGHLFREYLDVIQGRINPEDWETIIEGIEIFPSYITEHQRYIYDEIHLGDVCDILPLMGGSEFIFMSDVLEHIEKSKSTKLLKLIAEKSQVAIVMLPMGKEWLGQNGAGVFGNDAEAHVSAWQDDDMADWNEFGTYICNGKVIKGWIL